MTQGIVNIRGKEYHTVAKRVNDFHEKHEGWVIKTDLVFNEGDIVIVKTEIYDDLDRLRGTGYAEEDRTQGNINRTSALENCETSSIGRALACIGIGGTEYASANEVQNAIAQQEYQPKYTDDQKKIHDQLYRQGNGLGFFLFCRSLDEGVQTDLHNSFTSDKTKHKRATTELRKTGQAIVDEIIAAINENQPDRLHEYMEGAGPGTIKLLKESEYLNHDQQIVFDDLMADMAAA
ncbi:MAG: hypothetical protein AAF434_17405 [Pseudomonadota bacterium]